MASAERTTPSHPVLSGSLTEIERPVFVNGAIKEQYACALCNLPIWHAVQSVCNKRCCFKCITNKFGVDAQSIPCPFRHNREEVNAGLACVNGLRKQDVLPDNVTHQQLLDERVYCLYWSYGCDDHIPWREWREHSRSCPYAPVACPYESRGCDERLTPASMESHKKNCDFADVVCVHCGMQHMRKDLYSHTNEECQKLPATCEKCQEDCRTWAKLHVHQLVKCVTPGIPCYYCRDKFLQPADIAQHNERSSRKHLDVLTAEIGALERKFSRLQKQMSLKETVSEEYRTAHHNLEILLANECDRVNALQNMLYQHGFGKKADGERVEVTNAITANITKATERFEACDYERDAIHYTSDLIELNTESLSYIEDRLKIALQSAPDEFPVPFLNGCCTFVIDDYIVQKGIKGNRLDSPVFQEGIAGYNFQLEVYLRGIMDDDHISIYVHILSGPFDDILKWPLVRSCRISLLSPFEKGKTHSKTLQIDCEEHETLEGFENFLPILQVEKEFLKDDKIFIRCVIMEPVEYV